MTATVKRYTFTSESVSEGHPDKVCDFIADSILDAYLAQDPSSRVACEVLCKGGVVVLAGEITSRALVDHEQVVRGAVQEIGYADPTSPFHADGLQILQFITHQATEISRGIESAADAAGEQGAGDQGMMFGFATDETPQLMPLSILLAHRITRTLAEDRKGGRRPWLRPDAKAQVTVLYEGDTPCAVTTVLVSTQHAPDVDRQSVLAYVWEDLLPHALGDWFRGDLRVLVNPTGSFVQGGPAADCGLTGRKIIVDTYGGMGRHGGGAFSGKDPSKVDRSAAYFCRFVARQLVKARLARRVEVRVAYVIGLACPVSVEVDTFGTGDDESAAEFVRQFDFRPGAIIDCLRLRQAIYRATTNYGHFGRPGFAWEA
jgi:S-adenosylmethionine synthetase